jgi:cell division septal protein FtsQ
VLLVVAVAAATFWAITTPLFFPKSIDVQGNRLVPTGEVISRARIDRTTNLWLQNTSSMVKRIEAIPYIETAAVHRRPPANATIAVVERTPFVVLQTGKHRVVVDRTLRVLQDAVGDEPLPLLIVRNNLDVAPGVFVADPAAKELRADNDTLVDAHVIVASLSQDKFGELIVTLRDGVRVLLGDDENLQKKIALIDPILGQTAKSGRRVATIDLRAPSAPVVVYRAQK